jgi:hypothetical protein
MAFGLNDHLTFYNIYSEQCVIEISNHYKATIKISTINSWRVRDLQDLEIILNGYTIVYKSITSNSYDFSSIVFRAKHFKIIWN